MPTEVKYSAATSVLATCHIRFTLVTWRMDNSEFGRHTDLRGTNKLKKKKNKEKERLKPENDLAVVERKRKSLSLCFTSFISIVNYYAVWFGVYSLLRYSPLQKISASYIFPDYSQTLPPLLKFLFQAILISAQVMYFF